MWSMNRKPTLPVENDQIVAQLNRIRGQIDGIAKMYQDRRECVEIVQQVAAARSSLGRVARDILSTEAVHCSREKRLDDLQGILAELFR